ncbi:nucleotidyltransferase family protein [Amaricoccus solimangrovi]|uniref:Nucleotidyltransferase family protein n=1 Tax=Amaricoccus solimangrovi TaxID=2589815 RepID=A0A501WV92_9RHOB|nr:nucleotidyltransferase family protein [Amaricoccus solimangrovi]TPE53199.1 nucleotidyltransferase family protein [Amaricoccus solimangrovi]
MRAAPVDLVLLAAGAGRRMEGRDKLLEPVEGRPLLATLVARARASAAREVLVVLPPGAAARRAALAGLAARIVEAPDHAEGMGASLRAGVAALAPDAGAVIVMLGDMPEVTAAGIDALIAAHRAGAAICRAVEPGVASGGAPGHPVLFDRRFLPALAASAGDAGARALIRAEGPRVVAVPLAGAAVDLDTPADWAAWRAARPGR